MGRWILKGGERNWERDGRWRVSLGSEVSSVVKVGMRWGTEDASCKDVEI